MNHGVKYYKYPFDYESFYGSGRSTGTPGPKLTQAGTIPCCCRNLHDLNKDAHDLHCRDYDYWKNNRPVLEMMTNYKPDILQKHCHFNTEQYKYHPQPFVRTRRVNLPFCANSPEFRFGICSNCFFDNYHC
ncbi:hypothetical protein AVEN_93984-1 [Araneus ventricosus]|uniref:Uncharacterized protein n=1 Tax=Araneus ventricosus TaxID=182803 RepID=A0A4Y2CKY5_ARAVE|nr:hypothetical protein AVEN_93984-1 [Araneus ventricosus]